MGKILLNGVVSDDNNSYGAGQNNVDPLDIVQINKAREELEAKELLLAAKEKELHKKARKLRSKEKELNAKLNDIDEKKDNNSNSSPKFFDQQKTINSTTYVTEYRPRRRGRTPGGHAGDCTIL